MDTENRAGAAHAQLKSFVERIENLEAEKAALGSDITELYREAGAIGFDVKTLRELIRLRKLDPDERAEREGLLATYMHALEMKTAPSAEEFAGLPRNDTKPLKAA